jgi:glycerophosphoryl diester phosphodiesterase
MSQTGLFCFGHRGARGHAPENTLRSVRQALDLGAGGIEVDVRWADGQLMVIHDDSLERTTDGFGLVAEKSFAYLRSLDAGEGERIPTLAEIFDAVRRRAIINVELKGAGTAEPVVRIIEHYVRKQGWQYGDFLVSSFDLAQIRSAKSFLPAIRTGALIKKVPPGQAEFAARLGAWSLHPSKQCVTSGLVADAHRHGLKVFVYTVNRPSDIALMNRLGVDGVFTDYPERVVSFCSARNKIFP